MQSASLLKGAGALLMVLGVVGALVGLAKLVTDGVAWDVDTLYALVDVVAGLATIYAGWLAFGRIPPALAAGARNPTTARDVFAAPLLALIAGFAEATAFAVYGLASQTGITGVVTLALSIPLWMTYRTYAGAARPS